MRISTPSRLILCEIRLLFALVCCCMLTLGMPRRAAPLECSADDMFLLLAMNASQAEGARPAARARIILACLEGKQIKEVARELRVSIPTVSKWRISFAENGVRGLEDSPRTGKPVTYDHAFGRSVLALLQQPPPPGLSQWDGQFIARQLGSSIHAVWRILRREGVFLQRVRSWCVSTEQDFPCKLTEIVGLFLAPSINALVLSVCDAPLAGPVERCEGTVETDSSLILKALRSSYNRLGTLNLLAALQVGTGPALAKPTNDGRSVAQKHRRDFVDFLGRLLAELPPNGQIHILLNDNLSPGDSSAWLASVRASVQLHPTSTSVSWLDQVRLMLNLLQNMSSHQGNQSFHEALETFITAQNKHSKSFRWRKRILPNEQVSNTAIHICN